MMILRCNCPVGADPGVNQTTTRAFAIAAGAAFLETAANPYALATGDPAVA
jgi:fucose permease